MVDLNLIPKRKYLGKKSPTSQDIVVPTPPPPGGGGPPTYITTGSPHALEFIIDGGGSAITAGQVGHLIVPYTMTLSKITLLGDQTGSIDIDIWKDTAANFPPTVADSIQGTNPAAISSAQAAIITNLAGWQTTFSSGDVIAFNVDSCTTITRVTIILHAA